MSDLFSHFDGLVAQFHGLTAQANALPPSERHILTSKLENMVEPISIFGPLPTMKDQIAGQASGVGSSLGHVETLTDLCPHCGQPMPRKTINTMGKLMALALISSVDQKPTPVKVVHSPDLLQDLEGPAAIGQSDKPSLPVERQYGFKSDSLLSAPLPEEKPETNTESTSSSDSLTENNITVGPL
jgi:hypothetical protein